MKDIIGDVSNLFFSVFWMNDISRSSKETMK